MFAQLFAKITATLGLRYPCRLFFWCLSLILVLTVLCVVWFFWFLKLFYHSKVFPSLSTPFPATSLKFNTTEHSQTAHCTKHWHALVSETEQLLLTVFTFSAKVLSKWCIHMFTVYCLLLWHHLFLKPWCPPSASCRLILPPSFLT